MEGALRCYAVTFLKLLVFRVIVWFYLSIQWKVMGGHFKNKVLVNSLTHGLVITGRKEMFYITTHSTHFIYGHMVKTIQIAREETRCCHMVYSF